MIRETILFIFVLLPTVITNAQTFKTLRGDVNGDGVVNCTDIQEVINIIVNAE